MWCNTGSISLFLISSVQRCLGCKSTHFSSSIVLLVAVRHYLPHYQAVSFQTAAGLATHTLGPTPLTGSNFSRLSITSAHIMAPVISQEPDSAGKMHVLIDDEHQPSLCAGSNAELITTCLGCRGSANHRCQNAGSGLAWQIRCK